LVSPVFTDGHEMNISPSRQIFLFQMLYVELKPRREAIEPRVNIRC